MKISAVSIEHSVIFNAISEKTVLFFSSPLRQTVLKFLTLVLSALPNMMHFVRTFSIMRAYSVKFIAIEKIRNYRKIVYIENIFKMAGGRMHNASY